jgi:hypothetical protein
MRRRVSPAWQSLLAAWRPVAPEESDGELPLDSLGRASHPSVYDIELAFPTLGISCAS